MSKRRGSALAAADGSRVMRVTACDFHVGVGGWDYASREAAAIDAHWAQRSADNPVFFNGVVHVLAGYRLADGCVSGTLIPVEFKSFLHWRDHGYGDRSVRDVFGSALIRSAEGHVLLGRQRAGNLNTGLAYLPGGFIDPRDVDGSGLVDIVANVRREVLEETGLGAADLAERPGFIVTDAWPHLSIAVELVSPLAAEPLREKILGHLRSEPQSELVDIEIVRQGDEVPPDEMPVFTAVLLRELYG
jgi:8-oxo-dGTP pyrophosphatase MutT (NUDIX family)